MTDKPKKASAFYASTVFEDIAVYIAVTYACAAFCLDFYLSDRLMAFVRPAVTLLMIAVRLFLALFNGLRLRRRYTAAVSALALLPLAVYACTFSEALRFTDFAVFFAPVCRVICFFPYYELEQISGIGGIYFSLVLFAAELIFFAVGYGYTKRNIL